MDALEYIKMKKDICLDNEDDGIIICIGCIFNEDNNNECEEFEHCTYLEFNYPEKAIKIVEDYINRKKE